MNLNIQIGKFSEAIEIYNDIKLVNDVELHIAELECYVPTPTGLAVIEYIIKKENLAGLTLVLENDLQIKCANKHILIQGGIDVYADTLQIGDSIDTMDGPIKIQDILALCNTTFYDIGIAAPHVYYDPDGILHHNTLITATLAHKCESIGRSIIIVPNKSLVEQTEEDFINCGLDVGVYYGGRKDLYKTHTICTWQSLNILNKKSKDNEQELLTLAEFLDNVNTVIIDEVHCATSSVLRNLLTQNICNAPIRWGLTGTIPKEPCDYEVLYSCIGPLIGGLTAHSLQEAGVLANCHVSIKQLIDVKAFKSYADEVSYLVTNPERMTYIAALISEIAKTGNTLVLVNRIDSGNFLKDAIPDSVFICGNVKTKDRKSEYDEVKTATNKVIVASYGVASTGINIPRIFNLVLLEPGKSFVRVIQSIGRGIRKADDKDYVDIWDITSSCKYSKRHLTQRKALYKEAQYPSTIEKIDWSK